MKKKLKLFTENRKLFYIFAAGNYFKNLSR